MNKGILMVGMLLVLSSGIITRLGVDMNDFVQGLLMGVGAVGCLFGLAKTKLGKNAA